MKVTKNCFDDRLKYCKFKLVKVSITNEESEVKGFMEKQLNFLLIFLVLLGATQKGFSQGFPYHLYAPRTMSELAVLSSAAEETQTIGLTKLGISADPFYSSVRLEYAGEARNLSERKTGFYKLWATTMNIASSNKDQNVLDLLQKEYLFKECDKEYWITVSTPAANDFPKNLKKGDRITLYLMLAGGLKFDKSLDRNVHSQFLQGLPINLIV